jgi:hypothetical protein
MFYIVYPAGSHGSFLQLILNKLSGVTTGDVANCKIYDDVVYIDPIIFNARHGSRGNEHIMIQVQESSYLKYLAMCINRTLGIGLLFDNLGTNVFEKIKSHSIIGEFSKSLTTISGQDCGNVAPMYIREWLRLCFFANHGSTITQFIQPSILSNPLYTVDFESFYDGTLLGHCEKICSTFGLDIDHSVDMSNILEQFPKNITYYDIDKPINGIVSAIESRTYFDLSTTNLLQQAWIDNYLVDHYSIDPLLRDQYFDNTLELLQEFDL